MKRKLIIVFTITIMLITLTGCKNNKKENFILEITESSWSGWSEDYKPEEKTNKYNVELNKEYSINPNGMVDGLTFTIKEINKDNIVIETTTAFSDKEEGIDLRSDKKEFTIYLDKEKKLITPTMDAGDIYKIKLIKE